MIDWLHQENGYCEGSFKSKFFCDDEDNDDLNVYVNSPDLKDCAEECVDAFNSLTESEIDRICERIIDCAKENVPPLDNPLDILNYCWFTALYVNMLSKDDKRAYVVEGEGEWGEVIGFAVENSQVIYVGTDYLSYMKELNRR